MEEVSIFRIVFESDNSFPARAHEFGASDPTELRGKIEQPINPIKTERSGKHLCYRAVSTYLELRRGLFLRQVALPLFQLGISRTRHFLPSAQWREEEEEEGEETRGSSCPPTDVASVQRCLDAVTDGVQLRDRAVALFWIRASVSRPAAGRSLLVSPTCAPLWHPSLPPPSSNPLSFPSPPSLFSLFPLLSYFQKWTPSISCCVLMK